MTDFWRSRRVLVTGGTGFLGYHLIQQLLAAGAIVRSFALPAKSIPPFAAQIECYWGDIRDRAAVEQAVAGCEVVLHTAGPVAVWGPALEVMHEAHCVGTANVIAAAGPGVRVVHTSSIVAVGASASGAILDEDASFDLRVKIGYVQAKRAAEEVAIKAAIAGRDVVVVNPGYLVGPEDFEPSVMGKYCARVWKGKVTACAPGGFNLVDVRDVAAGHMLAAERGQAGRRYILGGENYSVAQFTRMLADVAGMRPRALPLLPITVMWAAALVAQAHSRKTGREPYPSFQHIRLSRYSWFVKSDRAMRELGYRPRPLHETVRDFYQWFAQREPVALRGFTRWWLRPPVLAA
ncbi:MAG: NAD-dependent epimerase/dehydratase family protein [Gemmataceae bacterium]